MVFYSHTCANVTPVSEVETTELLKKVRKIEIRSRGLTRQIFAGKYHSAFRGRGMTFSVVRDAAGHALGSAAMARDATERYLAERARKAAGG